MSAWLNEQLNKYKVKRHQRNIRLATLLMAVIAMASFMMPVVSAADMDPEKECSLELKYYYENTKFQNCGIELYRVGDVSGDGKYALSGVFAEYPVKIDGTLSATDWKWAAITLAAYAAADQISPEGEAQTDADGVVRFTGLPTGLYLVISDDITVNEHRYFVNPFLIAIPIVDDNDNLIFQVSAHPKAEIRDLALDAVRNGVIKLWKDKGYEQYRPDHVTVDILKNGKKVDQQILSKENHWSYFWEAENDDGVWQVVERGVPQDYTVTVRQEGRTFILVNTIEKPSQPKPPDTGDNTNLPLHIMLMTVSGVFLIVLGNKRTRILYD